MLPEMLAAALERQRDWGGPIGRVLVSTGSLRLIDLARLYSAQRGLPFVDLLTEPRDRSLAQPAALDFYLRESCLPWRRRAGETIYVAGHPDKARAAIADYEGRVRPVFVASPRDITRVVTRDFANELTDRAVFDLQQRMPESSAALRLSRSQSAWLLTGAILLLAALVMAPTTVFALANIAIGLVFLSVAALRYVSIFTGLLSPPTAEELAYAALGSKHTK